MDQIVLQFSTSSDSIANWASAAIRRLCHSPFSHVDTVLPDGNLLGSSAQGLNSPVIKGNPQGVAIRPPNYQKWGIRRRMILRTDKANAMINWSMTQLGKEFDNTALWDFVGDDFPGIRDWRKPDKWFCSEKKAVSFEEGGYFPYQMPWPKNRVSPTDLLLILLMDERWINRDTFWDHVPGLELDEGEK